MSHAMLAPSFSHVWSKCPAAAMMALQCPEEETQDARDGTAAHWVAATILRGSGDPQFLLGQTDPNGTYLTEEIIESACTYIEDVTSVLSRVGSRSSLLVEHPVRATGIHQEVWGTLDAAWYDGGNHLVLWDFKHGHRQVSPIWNTQMLCYLDGLLAFWNVDGLKDQGLTVEFRIVQPRCFQISGPVQTHGFIASDARGYFNLLKAAAVEAWEGPQVTKPGPHCADCPARHSCESSRQVAMFAADYVGRGVPERLTSDGLSFELGVLDWVLPQLEARRKSLVVEATARIAKGEFIPGYVLDRGEGRRAFAAEDTEVVEFGKALGVDLSQANKAVTVAEAERRLKAAGLDPATLLTGFTHRPPTEVKLKLASESSVVKLFNATGAQS